MAAYRRYTKKPVEAPAKRLLRDWSIYQMNIFNDIHCGEGNTHVEAKAGSGKTSSICEGFYHLPNGWSALMCAFAKPIQVELEKRAMGLPITVLTLHSLGFRVLRKAYPRLGQPDMYKLQGYIEAEMGDEPESMSTRDELAKAISLAKGYLATTSEEIDEIMDRHDVDSGHETRPDFIGKVLKIMAATGRDTSRVDFDDMIWMPQLHGLKLPQYDYVFIDEAQDLNKAQINMALNSVTTKGRILTVGDTNQAIYGFRGADSLAIQNIISRLNSKVLPLSITYRCAKAIVELAQTVVPELEASPTAEDGLVVTCDATKMLQDVRPGDFILSRTNAPLMGYCLNLLKAGVRANIQGKDLGKNFLYMIKKSEADSVNGFLDWLDNWCGTEVARLTAKNRDSSLITDKRDCFLAICEGTNDLNQVRNNIKALFHEDKDTNDRVILSTTHKAKGLERDRVFMLSNTYKKGKTVEESNLYYVAVTRAKKELYMVAA